MDLTEAKTKNFNVRVQPSLLAIFKDRCLNDPRGPVDPSDVLRRAMVDYLEKTKQGKML